MDNSYHALLSSHETAETIEKQDHTFTSLSSSHQVFPIFYCALPSSHKTAEIIEKRDHREAVMGHNMEEKETTHPHD